MGWSRLIERDIPSHAFAFVSNLTETSYGFVVGRPIPCNRAPIV